jgi:hypothetical protein
MSCLIMETIKSEWTCMSPIIVDSMELHKTLSLLSFRDIQSFLFVYFLRTALGATYTSSNLESRASSLDVASE